LNNPDLRGALSAADLRISKRVILKASLDDLRPYRHPQQHWRRRGRDDALAQLWLFLGSLAAGTPFNSRYCLLWLIWSAGSPLSKPHRCP